MPSETRNQVIRDTDPLLTSHEQDVYLEINQELKSLEQRIKAKNMVGYDPNDLKTHITTVFEMLKSKNKEAIETTEIKNSLEENIAELKEENNFLGNKVNDLEKRIKELIAENDNILDTEYQTIVEKNMEIENLKTKLINTFKDNNSSKTINLELVDADDHLDITTSQDFFVTPKKNKGKMATIKSPCAYSNEAVTTLQAEIKEAEDPNLTTSHNFSAKTPVKKRNKKGPSSPSCSSKLPTDGDVFFTPQKTPFHTAKNTTIKHHKSVQDSNFARRLENMESNLDVVLKFIQNLEKNGLQPNQLSKDSGQVTVPNDETPETDLLIIGDLHAKDIKNHFERLIPDFKTSESIHPSGTIPEISTLMRKSGEAMKNYKDIVFIAGNNDIQKTPMKEIKKSIDLIFQTFQNSTIHFVQIPYRFDNVNLNYHIEQVNNILFQYVLKYKNVVVYKPKELIENWDYVDKNNLDKNGKIKICKAIGATILGRTEEQIKPKLPQQTRPHYHLPQGQGYNRGHMHPPHKQWRSKQFIANNGKQTPGTRRNFPPHPVTKPRPRYSYVYDSNSHQLTRPHHENHDHYIYNGFRRNHNLRHSFHSTQLDNFY